MHLGRTCVQTPRLPLRSPSAVPKWHLDRLAWRALATTPPLVANRHLDRLAWRALATTPPLVANRHLDRLAWRALATTPPLAVLSARPVFSPT